MQTIEKLAIKYLIIGFGVGLLQYILLVTQTDIILLFDMHSKSFKITQAFYKYSGYLSNIIVGLFILNDALRHVRNKKYIPLLGFFAPVFGVCFLIIEKFLILKTTKNE
ncbi:hypothetical protein ACFLSE_08720 [Bacteroidota bacterium]